MESTMFDRKFVRPDVSVRANGRDGYTVVFRSPTGTPTDIRVFPAGPAGSAEARAFRDGVADGLVLAARVLNVLIG